MPRVAAMLAKRRISLLMMIGFGVRPALLAMAWAAAILAAYTHGGIELLRVPFLPIATVGTAVAFYVGFKNNSAYERFWEGRKIWGGIVNESRHFAAQALSYVDRRRPKDEALGARRELVYRQLAWINALRIQLRKKSRLDDKPHPATKRRMERDADHMRMDWESEIGPFLSEEEHRDVSSRVNPATHLLRRQSERLADLKEGDRLDLFHQIDMMAVVHRLYELQGKCERIKNTPFPRVYAEYSRWFTYVFLLLVPLGLLDVFADEAESARGLGLIGLAIPMCLSAGLITWVFFSMEGIGDATEDPFERSMNDVPMNALCRTIERDLRQMLDETDIPEPEQPAGHVLY